jgi:hypothetical protein
MNIEDITVGETYVIDDRGPVKESYTWGGRRHESQVCYRRPVTVHDIYDRFVLVEPHETILWAPPHHKATLHGRVLPPEMAVEGDDWPGGVSAGEQVWLPASVLACPWDDVADEEQTARRVAQERAEAIELLRDFGLDTETGDLGTVRVSVALLVEMVDDLTALRALKVAS